jgi:20S proteasome alpha/beta subunit
MSIGIAVAIGDAVLMAADGRRSDAFTVITDEAQKIVELADSQAVIEFGVVMASEAIVSTLRAADSSPMAGHELIGFLEKAVQNAGAFLVASVIPDSTDMSRIKVGLLAGGIDTDGAYVGGALYGHGMSQPSSVLVRPNPEPQFIVLGGEACGAQEYFMHELERAYLASGTDQSTFLSMAKRAAKSTVRHAASHDRTIGGRIQYCVLQKDRPIQRGLL